MFTNTLSVSVSVSVSVSHSLQCPDVLVPPLRENTVRAVVLWRLLPLKTFTGVPQAHSQPSLWPMYAFNTVTMKQVRALFFFFRQDNMSAHDLTRSATASEF